MSLLILFGGGIAPVGGTAADTLQDFTSSASGQLIFTGTSTRTLANFTSTASGSIGVNGSAANILETLESNGLGYYIEGARLVAITKEHRLAIPPVPQMQDPVAKMYLETVKYHTQDAFNRLAADLARLMAQTQDIAEVASNANFYASPITIENQIENGDINVAGPEQEPVAITVFEGTTAVTTGDGKVYFRIPASLDGTNLVDAAAVVLAKSTSGTPTVQIARGRQAAAGSAHTFVDMLSTRITIDANEFDSATAATPRVINTSNDDVLTGDLIRVDVDVAGTGTTGMWLNLWFQEP